MRENKEEKGVALTKISKLPPKSEANGHNGTAAVDIDDVVPSVTVLSGDDSKSAQQNGRIKDGADDDDEDGKSSGCCGRGQKKKMDAVGTVELVSNFKTCLPSNTPK